MKKTLSRFALLVVAISVLLACTGCYDPGGSGVPFSTPIGYVISVDKADYEYGEIITINFLFEPHRIGEYSYSVKLQESPYFEIIGENPVHNVNFNSPEEPYKVTFKIKVVGESEGKVCPKILIKCLDDDGQLYDDVTRIDQFKKFYSGDFDYPFAILGEEHKGIWTFGFTTNSEGIVFSPMKSNSSTFS